MEMISSSLKFNGYYVNEISYKFIDQQKPKSNIELHPILKKNISKMKDDPTHYTVKLSFEINSESSPQSPFSIKVDLSGDFNLEEGSTDELIQVNSISILFPYLREIISNITLHANIPPLILPVSNIAEMLK